MGRCERRPADEAVRLHLTKLLSQDLLRDARERAPKRVILPVDSLEPAVHFYATLLEQSGARVSPGRHYFLCGEVTLALYSPRGDGDKREPRPNFDHVYLAVDDLEGVYRRAQEVGGLSTVVGDGGLPMGEIRTRPWGERSFYLQDPFGNPLCFVDSRTLFTGRPEPSA